MIVLVFVLIHFPFAIQPFRKSLVYSFELEFNTTYDVFGFCFCFVCVQLL